MPKPLKIDEPFSVDVGQKAKETIGPSDQDLRTTRDMLRYFVQTTPGAHERLRAYIGYLLDNDPKGSMMNEKGRSLMVNAGVLAVRDTVKAEATRLMELAQQNQGKVSSGEVAKSYAEIKQVFDRVLRAQHRKAA